MDNDDLALAALAAELDDYLDELLVGGYLGFVDEIDDLIDS